MAIFFSPFDGSFTNTGVIDKAAFEDALATFKTREAAAYEEHVAGEKLDKLAYATAMDEINKARFALLDKPPCLPVDVPPGAVEISEELYEGLLAAKEEGRMIHTGVDGYPFVLDTQITAEDIAEYALSLASAELLATDRYELPSYRERKGEERYQAQMAYRAGLRDFAATMVARFEAGADGIKLIDEMPLLVAAGKPE